MKDAVVSNYKKLNTTPIPKKGLIACVIVEELYYIVWEKNIMKPKIFWYSFAEEYHALKFAKEYLSKTRFNILQGKILIEYGFETTNINVRDATKVKEGHIPHKYCLHPELSAQRKKTLRNLYRRNSRRLLIKLLSNEKSRK